MPTEQETASARDAAAKALDSLFTMNVKDAAVRPNLGDINFSGALPIIEKILGFFGMLRAASLDFVPYNRLQDLKSATDEVINEFKKVQAFTLSVDNPKAQRDAITGSLENHYQNWFDRIYPLIGFAIRSSTDFAALERDLRNKISQAEVTSKELLDQQQSAAKQAQETLISIQKAAAEAGVSQEAVHFKKEAEEHEGSARKWLWATAIMAVTTVAWGVLVVWLLAIPTDAKVPQIVQQTIGKLIILSGLYYGLVWCARNYNAARHNFIVNRHRQNALSTFETFVKAAGSEDVKEAVLLQATTSIFSSQPSGYTAKEADSEHPSKVIEILRSVGSAAKPSGSSS